MGTITSRQRKDGTLGHTAQIRIKRDGVLLHTESKTFDRKPAAAAWLKKRETELGEPGAIEALQAPDPTLADVIDRYISESRRDYGKTKLQVLRSIAAGPLGAMRCSTINSAAVVAWAQSLGSKPQTVGNYLAHLSAVFAVAKPAWGYPLDRSAVVDARVVAKRLGVTSRSVQRTRRPTLPELEQLLAHFGAIRARRKDSIPMQDVVLFALFSTRRLEEITRITVEDFDPARGEVWVRDMKHPGEKLGNDVRVSLPPEAVAIVERVGRQSGPIFPHSPESISMSFTRACSYLGIEDLHFHDLRHEGISRLFEMGQTIPQVAQVSGHRTWTSLKRYTHMREAGDKYAGWRWNPLTPAPGD